MEDNKEIIIHPLPTSFVGTGEVKGHNFILLKEGDYAFIYKKEQEENISFEVFKKKLSPLLISFEDRIYSETDFKYKYPKSEDFGVWAFTFNNFNKALNKFNEINKQQINE